MLQLLLLLLFAVLTGCASKKSASSSGISYYEADSESYDVARSAPAAPKRGSRGEMAGAPAMSSDESYAEPEPMMEPAEEESASPAAARMVHYDGYVRLRVARLEEGLDAVRAEAEALGGHVEQVSGNRIAVRVPVASFRAGFDRILTLGEVLDKSLTAQDVTDAFTSVDLRLKTAEATRTRLQALLAKAEEEQEKLQLIRQIQRLTEEIDRLTAQVRTLSALASFSRISVDLEPREALAWQGPEDDVEQLAWIRRLSPLRSSSPVESRKLDLPVPEGLVRLEPRGPYVAEAPDGARIWAWKVKNDPQGGADFWIQAVQARLARDFASAEQRTVGAWKVIELVDRPVEGGGEGPYTWLIAVRVEGEWLHLLQVMTPDPESTQRHRPAIETVLNGGGA